MYNQYKVQCKTKQKDCILCNLRYINWHRVKSFVIVLKPPGAFFLCFPLWPSKTEHLLLLHSWLWLCGRPLHQVQLSVTRLCAAWPSNKFICYPFVQFIELSEVSGAARPQIGPVRWEMERELYGPPSLPHHCREGFPSDPIEQGGDTGGSLETLPRFSKRFCLHKCKFTCLTWNQGQLCNGDVCIDVSMQCIFR